MFLNFFIANNDEIINPGILIKKYQISEKLFGFSVACYRLGSVVAGYLSSYIGADVTYIIDNVAIIIIVFLVFKNIERDC